MKITFITCMTFSSLFFPRALLGADSQLPATAHIHFHGPTMLFIGGLTICTEGVRLINIGRYFERGGHHLLPHNNDNFQIERGYRIIKQGLMYSCIGSVGVCLSLYNPE